MIISHSFLLFLTMFLFPILIFLWYYPGHSIRVAIRRSKERKRAIRVRADLCINHFQNNPGTPPPLPADYDLKLKPEEAEDPQKEDDKIKVRCTIWVIMSAAFGFVLFSFILVPSAQMVEVYEGDDTGYPFQSYLAYGHVDSFRGVPIKSMNKNNVIFINKQEKPLIVSEWRYENGNLVSTSPISTTILHNNESMEITTSPLSFGKEAPTTHTKRSSISREDVPYDGVLPTVDFYTPSPQ